jgi:hypothetical protein
MEVSDQLRALAALPLGKEPPVPRPSSPVARHYTDWTIPIYSNNNDISNKRHISIYIQFSMYAYYVWSF